MEQRIVISKSAKRKNVGGNRLEFMQMVVYKWKENGKMMSKTRHEMCM